MPSPRSGLRRRWLRPRLVYRLLAFNVLLVFVPAAGALYLDTYEARLLRLQERSMVQQGRLVAAALSGTSPLDREAAVGLILQLGGRTESRLRVLDEEGRLVADSSRGGGAAIERDGSRAQATRVKPLYRLGALLADLVDLLARNRAAGSPEPALTYPSGVPFGGSEVEAALQGRYGAATRVSAGGQRSLTLYSALPIAVGDRVAGVVLVSQSTFRLLADLYEVRLGVFRVFVFSFLVAVVLSWVLARTIAHPVRRMAAEARQVLDSRGHLHRGFVGSTRGDEIGELGRELEEFTRRLRRHLDSVESLAADVTHELKNPLASIRNAGELLSEAEDPRDRARFLAILQNQVARMERLLADLREVTAIDAGHSETDQAATDVGRIIEAIVESLGQRSDKTVALEVSVPEYLVSIKIDPDRLSQAVENLVDNALSFAPEGSKVTVRLTADRERAALRVDDEGPGIPPEHLDRVFARFFSYRPDEADSDQRHTGLGLAIVKAIAESCGGHVAASNRPAGGASFELVLPLLRPQSLDRIHRRRAPRRK